MSKDWEIHLAGIEKCQACPRLIKYCRGIAAEKRKAFRDETYWGRPVTPFGVDDARFVVVGLAPAAHGANRTGRMFTGDRSGEWLYRALHKAGFATQPQSVSREDKLKLIDTVITAAVKCAPPDNKPTPEEITNCSKHLSWELEHFKKAKVYLALGKLAFDQTWNQLKTQSLSKSPRPKFAHGQAVPLENGRWLLASYHPSQQNTFTGKLTEPMFDSIFKKSRELLEKSKS